MKKNVGVIDRVIRILIGMAIIGWGIMEQSWLGAAGLIPLLTGMLQWCPAYCPFGISTDGKSCASGQCSINK